VNVETEIRLERSGDGLISRILIDRPAKKNAVSPAMLERFIEYVDTASGDTSRIIVIQSPVPGVFSAGADINYLGTKDDERGEELLQTLSRRLQTTPKVTIAVSDGLTIGGGLVIFLSCDLRLATSKCIFRMPPVRLARVYEVAGIERFVRTIGLTAATEMLLTARQLDIDEARQCGLVTRVVSGMEDASAYCQNAAECPPLAQQAMKKTLYFLGADLTGSGLDRSARTSIEKLTRRAEASEDGREALRAFHEKRPPVFTGR
jgi:enoyl-CoA hydratase/carnithine racemase